MGRAERRATLSPGSDLASDYFAWSDAAQNLGAALVEAYVAVSATKRHLYAAQTEWRHYDDQAYESSDVAETLPPPAKGRRAHEKEVFRDGRYQADQVAALAGLLPAQQAVEDALTARHDLLLLGHKRLVCVEAIDPANRLITMWRRPLRPGHPTSQPAGQTNQVFGRLALPQNDNEIRVIPLAHQRLRRFTAYSGQVLNSRHQPAVEVIFL